MIRFVTIPPVRLTTREAKRATLAVAKLPRLVIGQIHYQSSEALNSCNFNVGDSRPLCPFNTSELMGSNTRERLQAERGRGLRQYGQHLSRSRTLRNDALPSQTQTLVLTDKVSISNIKVLPMRTSWSRYVRPRISSFLPLLNCEILLEIPGLESGCQNGVPNPAGLVEIP